MPGWYTRAVLFVSDVERSISFYVDKLGFDRNWRHDHDGKPIVAQVARDGCELILSSQEPKKTGCGRMFLSLDRADLEAARAEFEARGVPLDEGRWGYRTMIVRDPDGNELYFPYDEAQE